MRKAHTAKEKINLGREDSFNRDGDHTDRITTFRELKECCDILTPNRDEANKAVDREVKTAGSTNNKNANYGRWTLIVATFGNHFWPNALDRIEKRGDVPCRDRADMAGNLQNKQSAKACYGKRNSCPCPAGDAGRLSRLLLAKSFEPPVLDIIRIGCQ